MDIKEFSKELEKRTRRFTVSMIQLSTTLPNSPEGRAVYEIKLHNLELLLVQIIAKPIEPEASPISETRLRFVKVRQVKRSIG
jgi:hypothetical protein